MRKGHWLFFTIIILLGITCGGIFSSRRRYQRNAFTIMAREAVLQTLGLSSLALSYECSATRNPVIEGVCPSMSDIPGSYLYHSDCDMISPPRFSKAEIYRLEVHR